MLLLLLLSCTADPPPPTTPQWVPGPAQALEPAEAVAAADLDGDGTDELFMIREGVVRWRDQQAELGGVVQRVARGDVDGDGHEDAVIATGMGRGARDAPARIWRLGTQGATLLWEHTGPRNQVADLHVRPGEDGADRIFVAAFADRRTVEGGWLVDGALDVQATAELAMRMVPVEGGVLVGRLYGDQPKSPGDLRLIAADGSQTPVTTTRGVRALSAGDLDGDGAEDWLVADGWHYAYGEHADPQIRVVPGGVPDDGRVIARLDGSYAVDSLELLPAAGGRGAAVLARGSTQVVLLERDALGWKPTVLGRVDETGNAVVAMQDGQPTVVISGRPATRVPLHR